MLSIIRSLLQQHIDNIDSGNTNLNYEQQCKLLRIMSNVDIGQDNEINKTEAADGTTLRRWYATMVANGVMIDWDDSL